MAQEQKPLKGLYKNVNISVRALNLIIIACVVGMILFVAFDLRDPGFTVTFDSRGGTDVASQVRQYDEPLTAQEAPTREGYAFTGWYRDPACQEPWSLENDTVRESITLYAGWEPATP